MKDERLTTSPTHGPPSPSPASGRAFPSFTEVSDPSSLPAEVLVSIVMVTYRHAPYLAAAVEGIAAQVTDFPIELIIAEDGSPDETRDVAISLQRAYPHLVRVVFTPENKGSGVNTIFAFGFCRGEYIAYCEGDDFWIDEHKLARQVAALRRLPSVDLTFTRGFGLRPDGTRFVEWDYGDEERIIHPRELFASLGRIAPTASLVFRGSVLRALPDWFAVCPFGDLIVILAGSIRGGAHYDPRETICYRIEHPTSFTVQYRDAPAGERIEYFQRSIGFLETACDHYGFPRRHLSHRFNDYRLSRGKLQLREGSWLAGLATFAGISPLFVARGLWRRLKRVVSRQAAG